MQRGGVEFDGEGELVAGEESSVRMLWQKSTSRSKSSSHFEKSRGGSYAIEGKDDTDAKKKDKEVSDSPSESLVPAHVQQLKESR